MGVTFEYAVDVIEQRGKFNIPENLLLVPQGYENLPKRMVVGTVDQYDFLFIPPNDPTFGQGIWARSFTIPNDLYFNAYVMSTSQSMVVPISVGVYQYGGGSIVYPDNRTLGVSVGQYVRDDLLIIEYHALKK